MSDIELNDIELNDIELNDIEKGIITSKKKKVHSSNLYAVIGVVMILGGFFMILWLSESQFSEGTLRTKNVGESCKFKTCSTGLQCINNICSLPPMDQIIIYSNATLPPPKCPSVNPKIVTYFDYEEHPNHWLEPKKGFYKNIYSMPYGGCKEICSSHDNCKAISYKGDSYQCHLMEDYQLPSTVNTSWNYAIKVK